MRRPHWRKMSWVLIIWSALIVVWVVAGANTNGSAVQNCLNQGVLSAQACQSATTVGTGIGVALILVVGFVGFVFFSLIWFMTRPRGQRDCPACGATARKGITVCKECDFDFAAAARGVPAPAPAA